MAYVFNNLTDALDQSNANIFGGTTPPASQQGQTGTQAPGTPVLRGGDSTAVSPQGTSGQGATGPTVKESSGPVSDLAAIATKDQPTNAADVLGGESKNLDNLAQAQQSESNNYLSGQENQSFGLSNDVLSNAVGGNQDAMTQVSSRLAQSQAPQAAAFTSQVKLPTTLSDIATPGGLQTYLQNQGGANYTPGMAGLDAALIGGNQGYQQTLATLNARQQGLQNTENANNANLQAQAQQAINHAYRQGTQSIQNYLTSQSNQILTPLDAAVAAENQKRAALRQQVGQSIMPDIGVTGENAAIQNAQKAHPDLASYLKPAQASVNPFQFVNVGNDVGRGDLITQDQLNRFNNIETMLGTPNKNLALATATSPEVAFNQQAYQDALIKAAQGLVPPPPAPTPPPPPAPTPAPATPANVLPKAATVLNNTGFSNPGTGPAPGHNPTFQESLYDAASSAVSALPHIGDVAPTGYTQTPVNVPIPKPVTQFVTNLGNGNFGSNVTGMFSDIRAKTDITKPSSGAVNNMLSKLTPYQYTMKPGLGMDASPRMGVMAQDLEKSPLGAQAVGVNPQTGLKTVDYTKLFPAMTAALTDQNERIRAIEAEKRKKTKGY